MTAAVRGVAMVEPAARELAALLGPVRQVLGERRLAPTPAAVAAAVRAVHPVPVGDRALLRLTGALCAELIGAGPLEALLADPLVTDVLVNGPSDVWVDRGEGLERAAVTLGDDSAARRLAQRLAAACGRRLDDAQPWVDARLPDGTRVHAVLPPLTREVCLSLRTFRPRAFTLAELVAAGTIAPEAVALLRAIVAARLAFVVTGGTGSGKTTVLASLLGLVDPGERIVLVEDAAELRPHHPHVVGLQARVANSEGAGEVGLAELVRQALRMRPDRIVVGECRGAEVATLLAALNTGHEGGAATLHANSPADVPARLEALAAAGGLGRAALHSQLGAALRCVVHLRRLPAGRVVEEICVLSSDERGSVTAEPAWRRTGGAAPATAQLTELLRVRGVVLGGSA